MSKCARVSVLMSVYNEPISWLRKSVESILAQTFTDFEFLIIHDNPENKESLIFLREMEAKDTRIKLLQNQENMGLTRSLNVGLRVAKGKYIARMDADDISHSTRFKKQFDLMERCQDIVACGTAIKRFGKDEGVIYYENNPDLISINFTRPNPYMAPLAHPTAFIRRSILSENSIEYNENYKTGQDYGLWGDLLFFGKITNLDEILLDYRTSDAQITATKRLDQLSVVDEVIKNYITRWLNINSIEIKGDVNPYLIKQIRKRYLPQEKARFNSFIFGLLLNQKYDWKFVLKYIIRDLEFKLSLTSKMRLLKSKITF